MAVKGMTGMKVEGGLKKAIFSKEYVTT